MSTHFISKAEAAKILFNYSEGTIFTVRFYKRGNGAIRQMNCRKGVQKGVTGKGMAYNPTAKGLVPVYDMQVAKALKKTDSDKKAFRMIAVEGLTYMKMKDTVYIVK